MAAEDEPIAVGNVFVGEGTAIYDTETGSVLWVVAVADRSVILEPAGRYGDELLLSIAQFKSRVAGGRFELETGPSGAAP